MFLAMIPEEQESLLRFLSPLTPAWNNFLLLRKSLLGIPHGRSRWTWASAHIIHRKEEEEEIHVHVTISLILFER